MPNLFNSVAKIPTSTLVAWSILLFTLFPFVLLCAYNVPLGDDFWYADAFRTNGVLGTQILWYNEWSGRYMATFLISTLNPLSYGYMNLGFLHPLILLTGTVLSLKFLLDTIVDSFKIQISKVLVLSVLMFFYINYIPDVGESFYWMAGAFTYQVPVVFLFLYIAFLIKMFNCKTLSLNIIYWTFALLCLFVIIGSNEVVVVYVCLLNAMVTLYLILRDKKNLVKFLPLFAITIVLSYLMIFADGNFVRADLFQKPSFHLLKASLHSLSRGVFVLLFWIPTLMLLLLSIPGISTINISLNQFPAYLNRRASIVIFGTVLLLGIVFIGFFPSIYSTNWIPQRAYTPIFVAFMIAFAVLFVITLKFSPLLLRLNDVLSKSSITSSIFICILVIALSHNSNVMDAYIDITSGKASSYHKQVMSTYTELDQTTQDTIIVHEIAKRPLILPVRWPQRHNRLVNDIWQEYFNIEKVELK